MDCLHCKAKTMVTRSFPRNNAQWRERRCPACNTVLNTREAYELASTVYRSEISKYRKEKEVGQEGSCGI